MRDDSVSEEDLPKNEPQRKEKRLLRVDQVYVRKDRQWRYKKTAKLHSDDSKLRKYSIIVRRVIEKEGSVANTRVDVKGPKLADLLKDLLRDLGQLELSKTPPELSPQQLYHAWPGLRERLQQEESSISQEVEFVKDLSTAVDYLESDFGIVRANINSLLERGHITFELLWALFRPGEVLFSDENILRDPQAYMFSHGNYDRSPFQGSAFKYVEYVMNPTFLEYQGLAVTQHKNINGKPEEQQIAVTARIMVDPATFHNQNPNDYLLTKPHVQSGQEIEDSKLLQDHEVMLSNHRIQGFAFNQKIWGSFAISRAKPVIWNETAYDKLILEEQKKNMIRLLVKGHRVQDAAFDDFVLGKGKGLVGLLSGPPGVGKTLTAEVVAEMSRRPLFAISAGELGITVDKVDEKLGSVLEITRRWGCVLLIDEADVFLYKRGETQLERNALVSVFLRRLEWKDIDQAFKSRIHFSFHYSPLSEADRVKIWRQMLANVAEFVQRVEFSNADLSVLAERPMNGREIKNAVASATSIVRAGDEPLTADLVKTVIQSLVDDSESDEDS
ncbi:unnamed protein product [Colletotrichum noveboracense]|uniref:AAA+ ATPase domain-containing protein n=1 Tax=Colletotrichum noveboracense TaxID=2664923 RepID=A0A9W4RXM2_9PEZI|nr:unnamed protein product [Colletotrichum noveboracense]